MTETLWKSLLPFEMFGKTLHVGRAARGVAEVPIGAKEGGNVVARRKEAEKGGKAARLLVAVGLMR